MPYIIVALLVLLADQLSKYLTTVYIPLNTGSVSLIPGFLSLRNIHNYGAAFGILKNARWFFLAITVLLFIAAAYAFTKRIIQKKTTCWLVVLVLAGALGNAIDRLIYGYVVDMFQFVFLKNFAIFNVADIFITCGTILFCIFILLEKQPGELLAKQKHVHSPVPAGTPAIGEIKMESPSDPYKSAIESISMDGVEDEVAAVFHAISEKSDPLEKTTETIANVIDNSAQASSESEVETPIVDNASISTDESPITEEKPKDELFSNLSSDTDIAESIESKRSSIRYSDTELDSLEGEEEVFTLADILAEFSDD